MATTDWIVLFIYFLFRASPMAHGGSQARGPTGATAAGLRRNHSNIRSEPMSAIYITAHSNASQDP